MGEALKQRQRDEEEEDGDEELFDNSDSLLSNSDDDDGDGDQAEMNQNGPLYELSALVEQLPIKRGLSNYYPGKSQSYASLSVVRSLKDLPKKESPYKRKMMKTCQSYGGAAMPRKAPPSPRAASCASLAAQGGGGAGGQKPPLVPVQKNSCNSH